MSHWIWHQGIKRSWHLWIWLVPVSFLALSCTAKSPPTPQPSAREIPHAIVGREECLLCHGAGLAGAPPLDENHRGRTSQQCLLCHQPIAAYRQTPAAIVATPTPLGAATPERPGLPPVVPHPLEGRETCTQCHKVGEGVLALPLSHEKLASDVCLFCHQGPRPGVQVPAPTATMLPAPPTPTPEAARGSSSAPVSFAPDLKQAWGRLFPGLSPVYSG